MNRRLPAEWESQSGILLSWPHEHGDWKHDLQNIESVFKEIVSHIAKSQVVLINCYDKSHKSHIQNILDTLHIAKEHYSLTICLSNDVWTRDYGPITVFEDKQPVLLDFRFNGWGNKFPAELDNKINQTLSKQGAYGNNKLLVEDFILEGGSIDSDGQGNLLTTSTCLLQRHPSLDLKQIEDKLIDLFGLKRVIWLHHGMLTGDDTDSHIDMLARFISDDTIVYTACCDSSHPDYESLRLMENELHTLKRLNGEAYKLIPLFIPEIDSLEPVLPCSYTNFLFTNTMVLVPIYNNRMDNNAIDKLAPCFPKHRLIPIDCSALIRQSGSLHCVTMQLPQEILEQCA